MRILRFVLKQLPSEQAMRHVNDRLDRPPCLSPVAIGLVKDSLAKGCVLYLVRAGAWKRDRFLRDGEPRFGRLWDRSPIERIVLEFSPHVLEFLMWLTAVKPKEERTVFSVEEGDQSAADRLFFFLAYEALRSDSELANRLRGFPAFGENALIWLAYPNDFAGEATAVVPSFDVWFSEPSSTILESLQPMLENRWLEIERSKGQVGDWTALGQQGQVQGRMLEAFAMAANNAGRRDLVRFMLATMARVLATPHMAQTFWTGGLQGAGPARLADRLATQRHALALLRNAERFRGWEGNARRSGYLDEDFAASKFWLSEWERFNFTTIAERAQHVLHELEPLRIG
ncbi:MAG: hypothetical protein EXS09_17220 [Gemmataceae bacterium]|nr:hypothetical protein [Gemmataceae bacterium]